MRANALPLMSQTKSKPRGSLHDFAHGFQMLQEH